MTLTFELIGPDFRLPEDIKRMLKESGAKRYKVSMTPLYAQRSRQQNAYFHLLISRIATITGGTIDFTKDCIKKYALTIGYPPALDEHGKELLSDSGEFIPKPSHLADTREMKILIDAALYYAAEFGIDPGEIPE